jgi:hypothetical protein
MANIRFKDLSFDSFCGNLTAIREAEVVSALFSGTLFSAQIISAAEDGVFFCIDKKKFPQGSFLITLYKYFA